MPNTTSIATVDDAHFTAEVLESDVPVLVDAGTPAALLDAFDEWEAPAPGKWLDRDER